MIEFTDEEMDELHSLLQETLLYGDSELVYMTTENGRIQNERLSSAQQKVEDEAKKRKLW